MVDTKHQVVETLDDKKVITVVRHALRNETAKLKIQ